MKRSVASLKEVASAMSYLQRVGAEPRSMLSAVITDEIDGYRREVCVIKFDRDGSIYCSRAPDAPTAIEQAAIREAMTQVQFPRHVTPKRRPALPPELADIDPNSIFDFKSVNGDFLMLQHRVEKKDGGKAYLPWTYWDDHQWRMLEPEGSLPLWGLDQLKHHAVAFIHEGAKAARACREMVEGKTPADREKLKSHPWSEELQCAAHLGWIGGAPSPKRTDWSALKKSGISRVYIVSDNDALGIQSVAAISFAVELPAMHVQFTDEFPASFDLGDDFPAKMFGKLDEGNRYIGPSFRSCLHPATWATDMWHTPGKKGGPKPVLRDWFKDEWSYVEEADVFVYSSMPEIIRSEQTLNKMLAAFSHTKNTSSLIVSNYKGRIPRLAYRPDLEERIITDGSSTAINLYTPSQIAPSPGDPTPFLDFLAYLIPRQREREDLKKFIATLIARPNVRMKFGLLLVSERHGVGKTTLGESILAPLVGSQNVSFPSESQIVSSEFNGWLARKRLVVVAEIYSGHSWKAYNNLKAKITDRFVDVNEKFEKPYTIENWAHIVAFSNSIRALKMEEGDRRWFYPQVTEERWAPGKFGALHKWLAAGGLRIIRRWADDFGDYFGPGDDAPMTERKQELILESRSDAQKEAVVLAEAMASADRPLAVAMNDVMLWLQRSLSKPMHDSAYEIRKVMKTAGVKWTSKRLRVRARIEHVGFNAHVDREILSLPESTDEAIYALLRSRLTSPQSIVESDL